MFRGINEVSIDAKGRIPIPTRLRRSLGTEQKAALVVTIDTDEKCLLLYPVKTWQNIEKNLQKLPSFNAAARRIQRLLIGHATDLELDAAGRVLLPLVLRQYAELQKAVYMVGQGNKLELWSQALWELRCKEWLAQEKAQDDALPDEMKTFSL